MTPGKLSHSIRLAFAAVTLVISASCTHAPEKAQMTCANTDWFEVGRTDGVYGSPFERITEHQTRCDRGANPVNVDLYANGRNVGLLEFCTHSTGVQLGKEGRTYEGVCPAYLEAKFISGFEIGKRIRQLEAENSEVELKMETLTQEITRSLGNANRTPANHPLRNELDELRKRRAQLETEINNLESQSF